MPEHAIARAERSIHHVHELIQMVFTRPVAETQSVLGGLMAVFADDFSMVGTTGTQVTRQQVERLFKEAADKAWSADHRRRCASGVAGRGECGGALQGNPPFAGHGAGALVAGITRMQ